MNDRKTPRFAKIVAHVTGKTHFKEDQVEILTDERTDYVLVVEKRQQISFEVSRTEGVGHSPGHRVPDTESLEQAVQTDLRRLLGELPVRLNQWLESASSALGVGANTPLFDGDAQAFSYEWACEKCDSTGKLPCHDCEQKGKVTCKGCQGEKIVRCPKCSGSCQCTCTSCHGRGHSTCTNCRGSGFINCRTCGGSGRRTCGSCGGQGGHVEWVTVTEDIGKGPFQVQREVRTPCGQCGGQGRPICHNCSGSGSERCSVCNHGNIACSACGEKGVVDCNYCKRTGSIPCPTCGGEGRVVCASCQGETTVDCPECRGTGRRFISKKVQANIRINLGESFDSAVPARLQSTLKALGFDNYASEGEVRLISQGLIGDPVCGLVRKWQVTFPTWKTIVAIGPHQLEFLTCGKNEHLYDLSGSIDVLLNADREAVCSALKSGDKGRIAAALRSYFQSPEHIDSFVSIEGNRSKSDRPDIQQAFSWLTGARKSIKQQLNIALLALLAAGFIPAMLKMGFPYDWVFYFLLPGVILGVGAFVKPRVIRSRIFSFTGSQKVTGWLVESGPGWSMSKWIVRFVLAGCAATAFAHFVLYHRSVDDFRTLLQIKSATPHSPPQKFVGQSDRSSAPRQGELMAQGNERILGAWQGTYSCKGQPRGDITLFFTPAGAVVQIHPVQTNTTGCFKGRWVYSPDDGGFGIDSERWLTKPIDLGEIYLSGQLKSKGRNIEGTLEKLCLDFKATKLASPASPPPPCNGN